jgi:hypothetical protein
MNAATSERMVDALKGAAIQLRRSSWDQRKMAVTAMLSGKSSDHHRHAAAARRLWADAKWYINRAKDWKQK